MTKGGGVAKVVKPGKGKEKQKPVSSKAAKRSKGKGKASGKSADAPPVEERTSYVVPGDDVEDEDLEVLAYNIPAPEFFEIKRWFLGC